MKDREPSETRTSTAAQAAHLDYTAMEVPTMLTICADDAGNWAAAFCQHAKNLGLEIDEGWMIGWFANAIETSWDARQNRAHGATKPVIPEAWRGQR